MTQPIRKLTATQEKVAELVAQGYDYERIGRALNITDKTASVYVSAIADLLPNPDKLKPYTLVILWAAHRKWLRDRGLAA